MTAFYSVLLTNNLIPGLVQVGTGSTWKFQLGTSNELSKISFKFFLAGFEVHSDLQICLGLFLDRPLCALVLVQNFWGYSWTGFNMGLFWLPFQSENLGLIWARYATGLVWYGTVLDYPVSFRSGLVSMWFWFFEQRSGYFVISDWKVWDWSHLGQLLVETVPNHRFNLKTWSKFENITYGPVRYLSRFIWGHLSIS